MRAYRYIVGMLLTLLPERYREGMHLRGPAITCSIVQILAPVFIIIVRLFLLAYAEQSPLPGDSKEMFIAHGGNYIAVRSVAGAAAFWFHPLNMLLYYLLFEGVLRLMSALEGERILGSLPLLGVVAIYDQRRKAQHQRSLGPLVADEVVRGGLREGYDLKIYSCRPKLNWNQIIRGTARSDFDFKVYSSQPKLEWDSQVTIEIENRMYEMFKEESGAKPRRFVYYLRKNPEGRIGKTVLQYKAPSKGLS